MPDHPFQRYGPTELYSGLRAVTFDPRIPATTHQLTAGVLRLVELFVPESFRCTRVISVLASTAGVGLANSFNGIYDDQGNLLGQTADQSSSWLVGTATTAPAWARGASLLTVNAGFGNQFRSGSTGSGLSALPALVNMGAVAADAQAVWAGLW